MATQKGFYHFMKIAFFMMKVGSMVFYENEIMLHLSLPKKLIQGTQIDKILTFMNLISKFIKKILTFL